MRINRFLSGLIAGITIYTCIPFCTYANQPTASSSLAYSLTQESGLASTTDALQVLFSTQNVYVPLPTQCDTWEDKYQMTASSILGKPVVSTYITRYDYVELICRVLSLQQDSFKSVFYDTDNGWANAAYKAGLLQGKIDNTGRFFDGDSLLTQYELSFLHQSLLNYAANNGVIQNKCSYYPNSEAGTMLIPSNTPLPCNPLSYEEFRRVADYVAVHNLTEITLQYTIPYSESTKAIIEESLHKVVNQYYYEKPEYFNYLRKTAYRVNVVNPTKFEVTITFMPRDSSIQDGTALRSQAFHKASDILNSLYSSGQLRSTMSEIERAEVLMKYLASTSAYRADSTALCHTAWSVLCAGYGVCDGISSAFQLLLRLDGINSCGIKGYVSNSSVLHHWSVLSLDGKLLYVDATYCINPVNDTWEKSFAVEEWQFNTHHFPSYQPWTT